MNENVGRRICGRPLRSYGAERGRHACPRTLSMNATANPMDTKYASKKYRISTPRSTSTTDLAQREGGLTAELRKPVHALREDLRRGGDALLRERIGVSARCDGRQGTYKGHRLSRIVSTGSAPAKYAERVRRGCSHGRGVLTCAKVLLDEALPVRADRGDVVRVRLHDVQVQNLRERSACSASWSGPRARKPYALRTFFSSS
ncbi:hypothetical protein JB92DRAFT_2970313 [Gautieria morchelliformis]|nr:hypothetical protein JB92DRAFT_2970313 [Gautieria morchelliformis]